jgi:hypothetical protein
VTNQPTSRRKQTPKIPKAPNTKIAELYGHAPSTYQDTAQRTTVARGCPIRNSICDVSANRHQTAFIDLDHRGVAPTEKEAIRQIYGDEPLPLGICSCWTKRQNETVAKPWILCPKRLLSLEFPIPVIPIEVRNHIAIPNGTKVGVWREIKFRRREPKDTDRQEGETPDTSNRFFEYTFDYLLMALDEDNRPVGAPYIIEVMTSSTRGGGLTEHMVDVLLGRDQRNLSGVVKSVYTPNYRQVFERMLGQFIAKSEIAEKWGGRTIWVLQDVLLDYIEQTTAFDSNKLRPVENGNVFAEVYQLDALHDDQGAAAGLHLVHHKSLRGRARLLEHSEDYTAFLGLGFAPNVEQLRAALQMEDTADGLIEAGRPFAFIWGEDIDPRESEIS